MKKSLNKCLITAFFLFFLPSALLGSWKSPEGHFKAVGFLENWPNFEKTAGVDSETTHFLMSDFRAKTERFEKNWKFEIDYQIQGLKGETISQQRQLTSDDYDFFDLDQKQLFNLTASIVNRNDTFIYHRIDRLSATYHQKNYSVKIGRQAIRWGNGQLFNPLDHFNPFAPNSIDTEYKPGTDMVSGQYLTDFGDQLDWIIVPRRNLDNRELDIDESAFGIKWLHYTDKLELQGILSKEANEWLLGVELTGNLFNGLWNMDWLSAYNTDYQAFNNSLVANYHQAWKSFGHNTTGFIEYFYNGYGEASSQPYLNQINPILWNKIINNQLFVINQHYMDMGMTIEMTPKLSLGPNLIVNLQDHSQLWSLHGNYLLNNRSQILFGLQLTQGDTGSEFDGLYLTEEKHQISAYSHYAYLQFNTYF